jgi:hypothetical protein
MRETVDIDINNGNLIAKQTDCWEQRGDSTIYLFTEAFNKVKNNIKRNFSLKLCLADHNKLPYSLSDFKQNKNTIPCWLFHKWETVGIKDYDLTCEEIKNNGKSNYIIDKIFWIGNIKTNPIRQKLVNMESEHFSFINSGDWLANEKTSNDYVRIENHTNYRFLLDIEGRGYSARGKILMFSGRPLFYQERDLNEYWFYDTKPFEHYIPIKRDLSDLEEKVIWAKNNKEVVDKITKNALEFAENNLKRQNAINRYCEIIMREGT